MTVMESILLSVVVPLGALCVLTTIRLGEVTKQRDDEETMPAEGVNGFTWDDYYQGFSRYYDNIRRRHGRSSVEINLILSVIAFLEEIGV